MRSYKRKFIELLLKTGSLRVGGEYKTKMGRKSPYFVNIGDMNNGPDTRDLGTAYANKIRDAELTSCDIIYGIPEKGIPIAVATTIGLADIGIVKPWNYTRKFEKDYGEMTKRRSSIVGKEPGYRPDVLMVDDVITTAETKYNEYSKLQAELDNPTFSALVVGVDRQEVDGSGRNAATEFSKDTGIQVHSVVNVTDIYEYLKKTSSKELREKGVEQRIIPASVERIKKYVEKHGTDEAKEGISKLSSQ